MRRKIKVILGEDHPGLLHGMESYLKATDEIDIVGMASDGEELLQLIKQIKPDVVVTDLFMPKVTGRNLVQKLADSDCEKIVVYSLCNSVFILTALFQMGATGYVNKSSGMNELVTAITDCYHDRPYVCSTMAKVLHGNIHNLMATGAFFKPLFTELEIQIVELICQEKTSEEIARTLFKSKKYIDRARSVIFEKMQVKSSAGVVMYAVRNFFISGTHSEFKS